MPRLIIPDIHQKLDKFNKILNRFGHIKKKTQLGDWFDDFNDCPRQSQETAYALIDFLEDPDHEALRGNHDMHYEFNKVDSISCRGWEKCKEDVIRPIMAAHWRKMKTHVWYELNGKLWVLSHAGLHPDLAVHPVIGFSREKVDEWIEISMERIRYEGYADRWFQVGRGRGGRAHVGGITWLDWDDEFKPIENVHQIVGHTPYNDVRFELGINSENWCIDTHLDHVAVLDDDGSVEIFAV